MKMPDEILGEMAATYRERNKVYGDSWRKVGAILRILHPDGVTLETADDHNMYHLWSLMIVKITRFANTNLTHQDSIHDAAVYAALLESILSEKDAQ